MHVGRQFPWFAKNQVLLTYTPGFRYRSAPTRKMKTTASVGPSSGTYATPWNGLTVVSTVGDYWPTDTRWTTYDFVLPTDSRNVIRVRSKFDQRATTTGGAIESLWDVHTEMVYDGVVMGYQDHLSLAAFAWNDPSSFNSTLGGWSGLVNPTLFNNGRWDFGGARWADQPEYHPYRH